MDWSEASKSSPLAKVQLMAAGKKSYFSLQIRSLTHNGQRQDSFHLYCSNL